MSTLVNPSPAKVRVGSLIFFADSKVSTVIGVTSNSFIVSDQYNDLVDDVVYVSNVALDASGHLIVTLSNGDNIDAGLIKQVTGFSINGSQHLIVSYNDGTSTDLGAIFNGNITISGNLTVSGGISGNAVTGNSIIETMTGYSFTKKTISKANYNYIYVGCVKNGNKLTFVIFMTVEPTEAISGSEELGRFIIPVEIANNLYPYVISGYSILYQGGLQAFYTIGDKVDSYVRVAKEYSTNVVFNAYMGNMSANVEYFVRCEVTFLLSENLAS